MADRIIRGLKSKIRLMTQGAYYIYALKDPRTSPAKPFYIGKGTGIRAWEHSASVDDTRKGKRIAEIKSQKAEIIVSILADDLSELQALKLEAELISAFGTEELGGLLTNSVQPTGKTSKVPPNVTIPLGVREKAQLALRMLKEAVIELAQANPEGVNNAEVAKSLGLQSDYAGGSKDFLSFSLLGILMRDGKVARGEKAKYKALVR